MKDFGGENASELGSAVRGAQVGDWLNRNRNCFTSSQKRGTRRFQQPHAMTAGTLEPVISNNLRPTTVGDNVSTGTAGDNRLSFSPDWQNMTAEEKRVAREGVRVEVSPEKVTQEVL